jgi:polysaccharide pyruvyl transferase WcaK-like protein
MSGPTKMPKTVAVLGWYGHKNFGDDIILEGLRQLFHGWDLRVFSNDNKGVYPLIDFGAVNKCDLFVLGGGELINRTCLLMENPSIFNRDTTSLMYRIYGRTPLGKRSWVHRIKIPKIILGCGVNIENPNELNHWTINDLKQFDYIGLRDNASVNILKAFQNIRPKVHLFNDLAFSAVTFNPPQHIPTGKAAVIPTDRFSFSDKGILSNNIAVKSASWLKESLQGYGKTVFLAFGEQDNSDLETCKELMKTARNSEVISYSQLTLPKVLNLLSSCKKVFPYRLHGLILSFLAGAKYEFYPYHRKLQRVHDTLAGRTPIDIRVEQRKCFDAIMEKLT